MKLLLALAVLLAAVPARATVCLLEADGTVALVFKPTCVQGATLQFRQKNGNSAEVWVTDSWPMWGGKSDCEAAVKAIQGWGKDLLLSATIGGSIGFGSGARLGFVEAPKDCYALRSGGPHGKSLIKGLKQIQLKELVEKGKEGK
jgi:hypothetical protein